MADFRCTALSSVLSCTSKPTFAYRKATYFHITVGNSAYHCIYGIVGRKGIYRRLGPRGILFVSIASAAENFRSTCGLVRRAPERMTQRLPAATRHVGQATEDICLVVSSFFFIRTECDNTRLRSCPIWNTRYWAHASVCAGRRAEEPPWRSPVRIRARILSSTWLIAAAKWLHENNLGR